MRYLILVSHGTFAPGLHNALGMMAGSDREDIRSTSLLDGMDVDTFRANFAELVQDITPEDEIILTADIIGGSPLTTALGPYGPLTSCMVPSTIFGLSTKY